MDEINFSDVLTIAPHEVAEKPSNLQPFQLVQVEPGETPQDNSDVIFDSLTLQELLATLSHQPAGEEVGAVLFGEYGTDTTTGRGFTHVTEFVFIPEHIVARAGGTFNFSPEANTYAATQMDKHNTRNQTQYAMVGLAHTHPNFGVFISGATADGGGDDNLHAQFSQPGQVSLIYDPVKNELAVYSKGGTTKQGSKLNHMQRDGYGKLRVDASNPVEKTGTGIAGAHGMRLHKQILVSNPPPEEISVEV